MNTQLLNTYFSDFIVSGWLNLAQNYYSTNQSQANQFWILDLRGCLESLPLYQKPHEQA
ncbi:hypothetical protein H1Q63_27125 [Desmonostoc muscorum CCALA 125]|uniref:Uncharacterized protein n=1 Tax=Desmonostoc muscorum LEGE 12446 TaxID=1828758 RepID=A0A8J6ZZM4_DESMC|nr:hypothetical protein [Desmonostoc muscorum]MBX9257550.1 hypothetical protein [Desmonostoc muscorum CCALA 125]MCF2145607.1 hypothetical protein [Desmonostoc muscorum LEGE 12446]